MKFTHPSIQTNTQQDKLPASKHPSSSKAILLVRDQFKSTIFENTGLLGQISTSELNSHSTQTHKQTNLDCVRTSSRGLTALHPHWLLGQISTSEWDSHSTQTRNQTKLDCVGTSSRGLTVYNLAESTETNELVPHNLSLFAPQLQLAMISRV